MQKGCAHKKLSRLTLAKRCNVFLFTLTMASALTPITACKTRVLNEKAKQKNIVAFQQGDPWLNNLIGYYVLVPSGTLEERIYQNSEGQFIKYQVPNICAYGRDFWKKDFPKTKKYSEVFANLRDRTLSKETMVLITPRKGKEDQSFPIPKDLFQVLANQLVLKANNSSQELPLMGAGAFAFGGTLLTLVTGGTLAPLVFGAAASGSFEVWRQEIVSKQVKGEEAAFILDGLEKLELKKDAAEKLEIIKVPHQSIAKKNLLNLRSTPVGNFVRQAVHLAHNDTRLTKYVGAKNLRTYAARTEEDPCSSNLDAAVKLLQAKLEGLTPEALLLKEALELERKFEELAGNYLPNPALPPEGFNDSEIAEDLGYDGYWEPSPDTSRNTENEESTTALEPGFQFQCKKIQSKSLGSSETLYFELQDFNLDQGMVQAKFTPTLGYPFGATSEALSFIDRTNSKPGTFNMTFLKVNSGGSFLPEGSQRLYAEVVTPLKGKNDGVPEIKIEWKFHFPLPITDARNFSITVERADLYLNPPPSNRSPVAANHFALSYECSKY